MHTLQTPCIYQETTRVTPTHGVRLHTDTHTHTPHNALFPPYMNDMHAFHTTPNTKYILKLLLKKTYIHCTQMASIHYPYHTNYNRYKPYAYGHISQTHAHITYLYTQQHTPNTQNLNVPTNPHYTHCTQIWIITHIPHSAHWTYRYHTRKTTCTADPYNPRCTYGDEPSHVPKWPGFSIENPMSWETPQSQATQALVIPHIIEMNQDWTSINTSSKISAALGAKISGCSGPELRGLRHGSLSIKSPSTTTTPACL